jgi:hypothetical protein
MPFRWWIVILLFGSTTINYIDRQTLSVLAPYLKVEFHWSNSDFALVVIAFRLHDFPVCIRPATRPAWNQAGALAGGPVVLPGRDGDGDRGRAAQLCFVPVSARRRRRRELARSDQGCFRMVPEIRARPGSRDFRQRLGGRRLHCPNNGHLAVFVLWKLAAGIRHHRMSRNRLAFGVADRLSPSGNPPASV